MVIFLRWSGWSRSGFGGLRSTRGGIICVLLRALPKGKPSLVGFNPRLAKLLQTRFLGVREMCTACSLIQLPLLLSDCSRRRHFLHRAAHARSGRRPVRGRWMGGRRSDGQSGGDPARHHGGANAKSDGAACNGLLGACVCRDFRVWLCVDCRYHFPAWVCSGDGSGAPRHLAR